MGRKRSNTKKGKAASQPSVMQRLMRKPQLFAGIVFGLDIAMLIAGLALSANRPQPEYLVSGDNIVRSDPMAFFGVTAAVVLGINCVIIAFIAAGALQRKNKAAQILAAVGLLIVSLAMLGGSAYMAGGSPIRAERYYRYTDENHRLIVAETEPWFGLGSAAFMMAQEDGSVKVLARTVITEYADGDERYTIEWLSDTDLGISFEDGGKLRALTIALEKAGQ